MGVLNMSTLQNKRDKIVADYLRGNIDRSAYQQMQDELDPFEGQIKDRFGNFNPNYKGPGRLDNADITGKRYVDAVRAETGQTDALFEASRKMAEDAKLQRTRDEMAVDPEEYTKKMRSEARQRLKTS
jgi:hypothetical protein